MLNPLIVAGQHHGAVALGLSGALREAVVYDAFGQNLTDSFMDYAMAGASAVPSIQLVDCHTPSQRTPTGAKGMSEGGVMGAIGAVMAAVNDALAPFGVIADQQPLSPERIAWLLGALAGMCD